MNVLFVRHAEAASGADSDVLRPLTTRGQGQAEQLAKLLISAGVVEPATTIRSSPALRCLQTIQPLATQLGSVVVEDGSIAVGGRGPTVLEALIKRGVDAVICSHADVIGEMVQWLVDRGLAAEDALVEKASSWHIRIQDGGPTGARYIPPPSGHSFSVESAADPASWIGAPPRREGN